MSTPVLFLDCDGVINDHIAHSNGYCGTNPECVRRLNRILNNTSAGIVVSSAWRYLVHSGSMTLLGFESLLKSHGVDCHGRVIGLTCPDEELSPRGSQIRHWLNEHGGRDYVVLDDGGEHPDGSWYDMGIDEALLCVVWTDGTVGLTDADADRAIAMLGGEEGVTPAGERPNSCETLSRRKSFPGNGPLPLSTVFE